jgi:hypothetical protein
MYQDFDKMPAQSRVWIYQADRNLTAKEENMAAYFLKNAIQNWAAHGATLLASAEILESRFVIIALDENENMASGCSIDSSTHWVKELGTNLGIDFFDRSLTYIEGKEIKSIPIFSAKTAVQEGKIQSNTTVFNNSVTTLQALSASWKIPANQLTYIKRYFQKEVA